MAIDLSSWDPKKILIYPNDQAGTIITAEHWSSLWQAVIEQGDYGQDTLDTVIDQLNTTVWHPTDAAASISNPAIFTGGATDVSGQLTELVLAHNALDLTVDGHTTTLTSLQDQIDGISAGTISAFSHNDIGNRNAADAHPLASITGLQAALDAKPTTHAELADRNNTASHTAGAVEYTSGLSVAQKIANMDLAIAALSGGVAEIAHNDLLSRDAADSHPMSAVTGLVTALSDKQSKITASTSDPSGGSDGDVWIKYA